MIQRCRPHRLLLTGLLTAACLWPALAPAGIFGIPTNLDTSGAPTASSVDPPGWFILTGTDASDGAGDVTHQLRLFIEVTGSTLDILVFDPGVSGARDLISGYYSSSTTSFQLYNPDGSLRSQVSYFGSDTSTTDNRLVRFTPNSRGFYALNSTSGRNVSFSGLRSGVYEFRITMGWGSDYNALGVSIRTSKTDATPYNVFTIGKSGDPDTAMVIGALNSGSSTPYANITQQIPFFPYVTRGCSLQTSNFDMDTGTGNPGAGSSADLTDTLGAATSLTMSGATVHAENTIAIHPTTVTNLEAVNYGMYALTNHVGTQQNLADWRVADDTGDAWDDNPAYSARNPTNPIRMYLPNDYAPPVPPLSGVTAPVAPTLAVSARVAGGVNPPSGGQTTRFDITATVENPTDLALSSLQITIPLVSGAAFLSGTQVGAIDGTTATCTDGSSSAYRRCTFSTLAAGSVASLSIQVNFTPSASGLRNLTGPPAATATGTLSPEGTSLYLPDDTTVWAQYTPAFSSNSYSRTEYLGPLCNLVIDVGAGVAAPTRASLAGLRVDPVGQVEFVTGSQINTVAFNLYAAADAGRTTPRTLLTASPVPTPLSTSLVPILYRVQTGAVALPFLYVEEIDRAGRRHLMGPLPVADPGLRDRLERIEARLLAAGAQRSGEALYLPPAQQALWAKAGGGTASAVARGAASKGLRLEVAGSGLVEVPVSGLAAAGLPASLLKNSRGLRLTSRGSVVPFQIVRGPDRQNVLTFQADYLPSDYAARNVYVLSWGVAPPAFEAQITSSERPKQAGFARVELNQIYVPNAPQGSDPWLWERLLPGEPTAFPFDLPGLQTGSAAEVAVRVRLALLSTHQFSVQVWLNGASLGSVTRGGGGSYLMQGRIPAAALLPAGNQLTLAYTASGDTFEEPAFYLDYLEVAAPLDAAATPLAPDRILFYDPSLPNLRGTDYLIVSHPLFLEQAKSIAALKAREGYRPTVVDVERVYDRFSAGIVEPTAIRTLLQRWAASGSQRQRHLLLVGDDTFDPRNYTGTGEIPFIPSLTGWDPEFGRVPSENRYADLDGDGQPDLSIGRLPVQTVEQAAILADKIARQASVLAQNGSRHLLAVDNQGPGDVPFRALAEEVAAAFFPRAELAWADIGASGGIDGARAALQQALRDGALATHYFGHAGPEIWADEGLLTPDDLEGLAGTYRETVLFTWACQAQFFQNLFGPSLNEALLLLPGGGALASFGPAGITDPVLQRLLYTRLYRHFLVERLTLGEAIRRAKAATIAELPESRPVIEGWNLLGDPALRLPQ